MAYYTAEQLIQLLEYGRGDCAALADEWWQNAPDKKRRGPPPDLWASSDPRENAEEYCQLAGGAAVDFRAVPTLFRKAFEEIATRAFNERRHELQVGERPAGGKRRAGVGGLATAITKLTR